MAHPKETRSRLRGAYLGGLPLEQAALKAGVPLPTARRWKAEAMGEGDDWDKFQAASLVVAGGGFDQVMGRVAAAVILRTEAVMESLAASADLDPVDAAKAIASLADSLGKAKAATRGLMPQADQLAVETAALKAFVELLVRLHPGSAEAAITALQAWSRGER
jgi:hypothetical protein